MDSKLPLKRIYRIQRHRGSLRMPSTSLPNGLKLERSSNADHRNVPEFDRNSDALFGNWPTVKLRIADVGCVCEYYIGNVGAILSYLPSAQRRPSDADGALQMQRIAKIRP